ncbi:hypothetical protein KIN20_010855 [Parelaphostrongylus tenuis]|uniref:Uncharacterized protein n=1 Tax=Parelaphostrongylus tenuis TaxID=148309 RepID=A0AAD5MR69_PARTN|nr:hypothetical protein KIN20_010855 [Parelaphostrongylus tenuis]
MLKFLRRCFEHRVVPNFIKESDYMKYVMYQRTETIGIIRVLYSNSRPIPAVFPSNLIQSDMGTIIRTLYGLPPHTVFQRCLPEQILRERDTKLNVIPLDTFVDGVVVVETFTTVSYLVPCTGAVASYFTRVCHSALTQLSTHIRHEWTQTYNLSMAQTLEKQNGFSIQKQILALALTSYSLKQVYRPFDVLF